MYLNLEYGDWGILDDLQRRAVMAYGYESDVWLYLQAIKREVW